MGGFVRPFNKKEREEQNYCNALCRGWPSVNPRCLSSFSLQIAWPIVDQFVLGTMGSPWTEGIV